MEDLLQALSDYLLDSGFQNPFMQFQELDHTLDDLREALAPRARIGRVLRREACRKPSTRWAMRASSTS